MFFHDQSMTFMKLFCFKIRQKEGERVFATLQYGQLEFQVRKKSKGEDYRFVLLLESHLVQLKI